MEEGWLWMNENWLAGGLRLRTFEEFTPDFAWIFYQRARELALANEWKNYELKRHLAEQTAYKQYIEDLDRDLEEFYYPPFSS